MTESSLGDRLRFVIWLSALHLGTWTAKEFAAATKKSAEQFPRWAKEKPRPDWSTIKDIASAAGVGATWLDDPKNPEAKEPDLFSAWLGARRAYLASLAAVRLPKPIKKQDVQRLVAERHAQVYGKKKKPRTK